jgi:hypothetical protein
MQHLRDFVLSQGARYQDLVPASQDLEPRSIPDALADGLDGWSFLMRTPSRDFALAYFEQKALAARLRGFEPGARHHWFWFDPRRGTWSRPVVVVADSQGTLSSPPFPEGGRQAMRDVAARIQILSRNSASP